MAEPLVLLERPRTGVAVVTLNRPDKRNALNIPLLEAFCKTVEELNSDGATRVMVVTGAGPVFCAGLDLAEARDAALAHRSAELVAQALGAIMTSPNVTIAAVQGAAVAGGAGMMLACDFVVAAQDLRTGFPEVRRGLVAGLVMTFLRRKVPEHAAREMLLLGELIDAQTAQDYGMVHTVCDADAVMSEAIRLAELALQGAPDAIARTKALFDALWHRPIEEHLAEAQKLHEAVRTAAEAREGLAAFAEKRLPNWDPGAERA